ESKEVISWLKEGDYDILVEATHCNYADAEPAISYIRTVLSQGKDVATANKAPIALGLRELKELSDGKEALLRFESTVMDGTPIFSVFRDALPKLRILRIRGILNSTANIVLDYLHQGKSVSEGLRYSQSRGIAETDPSLDLGGHDAAAKLIILSNALNNTDIKFEDVSIQSVTESNYEMTKNLARDSQAYIVRQISVADFESHIFKVGLERVVDNDPLYACRGSSNSVSFNTDIYTELIISGNNPTLRDTAFGIYSDLESIRSCRMRSK
ncbi:MAG: hypothetical protein OEV21_07690, partial [Thermoplasmata archaeon]|nr:hypothetical protein [Thermoplasmata archaeon]